MNEFVARILKTHLPTILNGDGVAVPDDDEEMNWRLFFAHSQDMQGFRADIFTGGPNEARNPYDRVYVGLRERWGRDSKSLIADLAAVWDDRASQAELRRISYPYFAGVDKAEGTRLGVSVLRGSGIPGAVTFADALDALHGGPVSRKTNKMIRSYAENASLLRRYDSSFREYLARHAPPGEFPPRDVSRAERRWVEVIEKDFYNVGAALARYLICDWLLWLWRAARIDGFATFKPDSVHLGAVEAGLLPEAARRDFVAYSATIPIPEGYGLVSGKPCPPRVLNECIWIERNRSSGTCA